MEKKSNVIVNIDQILPPELFIIPLRYRPVFPGMVTPLVLSPGALVDSIEEISRKTGYMGLVLQKGENESENNAKNLYMVGTAVKIIKKVNLPDGGLHLLVNTIQRFTIDKFLRTEPYFFASVHYYSEPKNLRRDKETIALTRAVLSQAREMMSENPFFTEEMKVTLINVDEPGKIADFVCSVLNLEKEEYQQVLEIFEIKSRLERTLQFLARELELFKLQRKIQGKISDKMESQQREFYLREQLRAIRSELGMDDPKEKDAEHFRERIVKSKLSEEALEKANEELAKLEYVDVNSSEYGVIRNYLETILELPWEPPAYEAMNLEQARRILRKNHYGLEDVKTRIIEFLAVRSLRQDEKGSIICLVGPPGVGKTSLGRSIARAMNRKFFRFSLGGMRDEAEIKGHRRTYVGAMPGKIIQALKVVKASNPVLMLDEIDKLGISFQGDPASALLEVLDPEQNVDFRDHYLDIAFDLSHVTFITTANTLEGIPGPLLDRMEIIRLSGYVLEEKIKIAQKYIIPRTIEATGLKGKNIPKIPVDVLSEIVNSYSREAGVRSLEKNVQKIYRKIATDIVLGENKLTEIKRENLKDYLGSPVFSGEEAMVNAPGIAVGLAWTAYGGATLLVETKAVPGRGRWKITGQLGKVMEESSEIAITYVKSLVNDLKYFQQHDIHIHVPDGATPKDGPSAGITLVTALLSLYMQKQVKSGYAMTGEIRLTGQVLPIGGLKEKTLAARRAGIKHIIFPMENNKDWEELPDFLRRGLTPHPVSHYDEVKKLLL